MTVSLHDKWVFLASIMGNSTLPPSAKTVAFLLLDHLNTKTERCDPSLIGMASRSGISERSVVTAINSLVDAGHFERQPGGGRGHRTSYRPRWETLKAGSGFKGQETLKSDARNTEILRQKTLKPASHEYGKGIREEAGKEKASPDSPESTPPPAQKKYAFEGEVIRLTVEHFNEWQELYHGIPDLMTKLASLDARCASYWPAGSAKRKGWFYPVSRWLEEDHQKMLAARRDDPAAEYWASIERGEI